MGWTLRKSIRLIPGIKVNLSKRGPSLSVGVPGIRGSVNLLGKARIYGGAGPLRYQKAFTIKSSGDALQRSGGLIAFLKRLFVGE